MTDATALLAELAAVDIHLRVEGGRLRYDAPAGAFSDALKERVRSARSALMSHLAGPAPLSSGQERMWFLNRLEAGGGAYTEHLALDLRGPLDLAALTAAVEAIVARHAPLRTLFRDGPSGATQVPAARAPALEVVPIAAGDLADRLAALAHRPFDLATEAPARFTLLRVADDHHVLSVAAHHAAWDGWSNGVFLAELAELYTARRQGRPPSLPEIAVDIPTLARAERERLGTAAAQATVARLAQACQGFPTVLSLPTDRPRGAVADGRGAALPVRVSAPVLAALDQAGRQVSATSYMVLLAAWALTLARLTGQRRLLVGAPVAGRDSAAAEALIGYLSNTVVFPIDLEGAADFATLVGRVRQAVLAGLDTQSVPFEALVEALAPPRSAATTPLVQTVFALQPAPVTAPALAGLEVSVLPDGNVAARYELMLNLLPTADGGLEGSLIHATALLDQATVTGWRDQFLATLADVPAAWNRPLDFVPQAVAGPDGPSTPDPVVPAAAGDFATGTERRLAAVWAEFLQAARIGRDDDFFLLGGHSLLLMRMVHRVAEMGLGRLSLADALANTRLSAMAAVLDRRTRAAPSPPVVPDPIAEEAPASPAQEGLWLARRDDPDAANWMVPSLILLDAGVGEAELRSALARLAALHPALRTTLVEREGQVWQRVAVPGPVALNVQDGMDGERVAAFLRAELARPFDLSRGPLYRFHLLRGTTGASLYIVADHIVTDGWSQELLARDLHTLLAGGDPPAPELTPIAQAQAHRTLLAGPEGARLAEYWRTALDGMVLGDPPGALGRRPPAAARRGRKVQVRMDGRQGRVLDTIAQGARTTPTAAFAAVVATLLARLKGDGREVAVGLPFACRTAPEMAGVMGCYAEVLPIRLPARMDQPFQDHLVAARQGIAVAIAHQDYPLSSIIADRARTGGGDAGSLFDAVVVYDDAGPGQEDWFAPDLNTGKYDLAFILSRLPDGGGLLAVEYDSWLYDEADARAFIDRLAVLMADIGARPQAPLGDLEILPTAERDRVVGTFNQTALDYPRDADLGSLWRSAAARHATRPALTGTDGVTLSYAELEQRVGALSAALAGVVGDDAAVGLALDRDAPAVIATLALTRLGVAYLPLDAKLPVDAVRRLMADAGARLVLADDGAAQRLADLGNPGRGPGGDGVAVVRLDLVPPAPTRGGDVMPARTVDGGAPAYIMFTSGSTGLPKGVVVPHRGVARLALDPVAVPITADDVVPQAAPLGFDAATLEIWGTFLNGAHLRIVSDDDLMDPAALATTLRQTGVSVLWLTAGLFNRVADEAPGAFATTRVVLTGGEAANPAQMARVLAACPGTRLINAYGPTENTTFTSVHAVTPADLADLAGAVPIGRPIANTRVYLVDDRLRPVPVGVWGELLCAGDGLALGYANRADLTEASFVHLDWAGGERAYRSGDYARWRHDGVLEFGGRRDGQVKIRGHRIETGAIEAVLEEGADIRAAAVVVTGQGADRLLVACVVADDAAAEPSWRQRLGERLPSYMMPARFVLVPALPVNRNGKVDRRALARHVATLTTEPVVASILADPRQRLVARVFTEFFPGVAIDGASDFMRLGGHSLLVMRLAVRLADETGCRLPMRALFAARTVTAIAALLPAGTAPVSTGHRDAAAELDGDATIPCQPEGMDHPLSPGQERLIVLQRLFPGSGVYNVPVVFDVEGPLDQAALERAFVALETRHHALRLRIVDDGQAGLRQRLAAPGGLRPQWIEVADAAAARAYVEAEMIRPFDLGREGPARAQVVRFGPERWRVLLVVHHAFCDGWSMTLLVRDLTAFYAVGTGAVGDAAVAGAPQRQMSDYAVWQRALVAGPQGRATLARQVARLTPPPPPLDLPTDHRRPAVRGFKGGTLVHAFDGALSDRLTALAHAHRATPFALATALVQALLYRLTGQTDLALGTLVAPRERPELADTVGFFVNTLVLRQAVAGNRPFRDHLAETRDVCLQAMDDQHCPFEALVAAVDAPRDLGRNPLFDVLVVWQEAASAVPNLPGLRTAAMNLDFPMAKFDLAFHFCRRDGGIACEIEYSAELFAPATITRLANRLETLARAVVADTAQAVDALDLLPAAERALVVHGFNDTVQDLPVERVITAPFLDRIAAAPAAPALVGDDFPALDYRGFARTAARLAARLREEGVGPGDVVGLCLPRGPGLLTAIFGVLMAGAAYAPLGADQPPARLADMMDDLGRPLVLATTATRDRVAGAARLLEIDHILAVDATTVPAADDWVSNPAGPDDLAYVLFTSGSTGRPKGVEIIHRAVLNRLWWMQGQFPIGAGDVVLQKTPVTFDVSVWELFWWSWTGAALALPPPGLERDPVGLAAFIARHRVTVVHFVPSMLAAFLACVEDGRVRISDLKTLRYVFASGEALDPGLAERFDRLLHRVHGTGLHNLYGPTEATVDVSWHPCTPWTGGGVPIGRPVANTRLYVLDGRGQPTPIGVAGEIHIGGVQVARGYRNRPDLTAERFIADPFAGGDPDARLYRTGDLGRWRADGSIDYLGRIDHQVKVRGQRIEPGEIEHALEAHPAVERAAVVPATSDGLTELHAYLLLRRLVGPGDLVAHLAGRLPEAMVPARFFQMAHLPLTSSGKLDRKALAGTPLRSAPAMPMPATPMPAIAPSIAVPADADPAALMAIEGEIAGFWRALLPEAEFGPRDGFFTVGGNSLLVIRLHQRLEARWPGVFAIADLFAAATVADQARRVAAATGVPATPILSMPNAVPPEAGRSPVAASAPVGAPPAVPSGAIAVVGLAVRVAGAETLADLWTDVAAGVDRFRPLPAGRVADVRALYAALGLPVPATFREAAYLEEVLGFDCRRYRLSPADAALIDPEQRLFLDVALRALEDAGRGGTALDDAKVGVFVGASGPGPWRAALLRAVEPQRVEQAFALTVPSNVATRLSFQHNWRGPAALVDTACSASLSALHQGVRALRAGDCDWALVGGAKAILLPPGEDQRLTIDSSSGRTLAFAEGADGTGMGEGAVALLLRPLAAALAARDPIHAVILGTAVNQDGASSGMAAPNPTAQAEVIRAAAADAGVSLASLSYVEAHGTGTALGDPIEIQGLTTAFAADTAEVGFAWVGSAKGNYGHLDGAAGVLGLARAILSLTHDLAPPQPHFTAPNPKIAFDRAPVAVPRRAMALADRGGPRRAGISAFGLSGVNVHAVVEAAPARVAAPATGRWIAVGLSAAEPEALRGYADAMVAALRARPDWSLEEIARTLTEGRDTLPARLAVAVRDRGDLMARLAVFVAAPAAAGDLVLVGVAPAGRPGARWAAVGPDQAAAEAAAQAFVAGAVLTWGATDGTTGRAHLPAAPLARRRLAPDLPAATPVVSTAPGLLGPAAVTREGAYHSLDVHAPHFWPMAEHRLDGEPTLVGMAFPALVATARGPSRLRDLRWLRPLRASQVEPRTVTLRFYADGRASLEGRARGGAWQTFVEARLDDAAQPPTPVPVAEIVARCAAPTAALPLPTEGPVVVSDRWRRLDRLVEGEGECLAWASPATAPGDGGGLALDPALLDVSTSLALDQAGLIPALCDEIVIHGRLPSAPVVHVRWRAVTDGREAEVVLADPADGRVAVAFHGLRFLRRATGAATPPAPADIVPSRPIWTVAPLTAPVADTPVLVVGEGALVDGLVRHLTTTGLLAGQFDSVAPDQAAVAEILAAGPVDVVLAPGSGPDLAQRVTGALRVVLGALVRPTRLLGVGFGAFAVDGQSLGDPAQAITFGTVLCAGMEEALLSSRYVDAGPATPAADLLAEFTAPEAPFRAVAWRDGERLVRGFAPLAGDLTDVAPDAIAWPSEGVCVVTGGLGGLSLLLAPTLAAGGDVALALLSRQGRVAGADPDAQARSAAVERLRAAGLRLSQHACDVTDRASLAATLDHIRQSVGPITAVVHNAGVSDGGFLVTAGHDIARELAAKVVGARLLDELTRDDPLRAFVMAGSLTGLLGAAGLAGYTAGNAFLDGFAAHRRAQGRPALTVDWCMIGEVGMAARTQHARLKTEAHLGAADLPVAWRRALASGEAQVAMLDPYAGPPLRGETRAIPPLSGLPAAPGSAPKVDAPADGGGALEAALAAVWAQVLGYDAVAPQDDFYSLGGDSIAGMQIVERVVRDLGHAVTLADLLDAGTVAALAARLRAKSRRGTAVPASSAAMALETPALPLAPEASDYPVAWEQLAVLNAEAVADMGTAYNLPMGLNLAPGTTAAQVATAVEALVTRHGILRTRFLPAVADGAEPTMALLPRGPITLERLDLADGEGMDAAMRGWVRPIDLYGPPPARFALLAVAGQPRRLLLDVHHALADAFSVEVVLAELDALLRGRALSPVPARELKDYAWWSRRGAGASDDAEAAAYWRQRFATLPPVLDLPADRARPAQPSRRAGTLEFTLPPTVMAAMRAAAAARRATPFALVTAAWSVLLARYAQVDDLVIAVPVDSRAQDGLAGMVGMMVSLLPLRLSVMAGDRVADLVDRAQATCTEALRHRAYGLGRLLADLAVPAQPGRAPLADVTLSYMNFKVAGDGAAVDSFGLNRTEAKADLAIFVRDLPDAVQVACEYAADLFDPDRIARLADHFQTLLAGLAAAGPDTMVASLPLMPPVEVARIAGWERGATPALDLDLGLFGAFARQAMSNPAKVALRGPDGDLTYGALLRRASGVAARLAAAGVRPGDRVALHVERDAAAVALVLGIAGAGAAYMPLDPTYPPDRVAWLLEDGGCAVAVADAAGRAVLSDRLPVLAAEEMREAEADTVPTPPTDGLAYLLYTSGSTGRPKGVLVSQRAVLRLAQGDDYADIRPDDRVTQTGSLAFDASTYEIWTTLIRGATLCLVTREQLLDPVQLSGALRRYQATVAWMTTGLFNRQADADPSCFQGMRAVLTGGEAASPAHLRRVLEAAPDLVLLNAYGPTENTTFSAMHRVTANDLKPGGGPVPIGRPIAHTRVAVLDPQGHPVPTGVWGEIVVGGLGLADGYNGRPDLTAERFRADPEDPAQTLYWTGDLGRWRADGVLEFGGRRDSQVKIRGYRIELDEIEQVLATCPGVARAVVLHRPQPGDLVAFHQEAAGAAWAGTGRRAEDLRAWLADRLPAYMVPNRFVAVADVPVTTNGKVDRARLLAALGADLDVAAEPPRPGMERLVADILADLFNRPVEDRRLGFLALGGHSLLAIRVVNRIAEATGVRLAMRDFFAADTVAELAALAGRATETEAPIPRAAEAPDYPASHAQARLYLAHRLDSDSGAYNITFTLPATDLDPDALAGALDRLVRDHEPLRTLLFEANGAIRQRIEPEAVPTVAVVDVREADDPLAEALRWARREAATPFDLTRVPLARARALRLDERSWLVLLVMHHVVGDGWSTRILLRELTAHYRDVVAGVAFAAPERAITYRDFAVWQAGRDWRAAADYWRRTLDGAPGAIVLPLDRPAPAIQSHRGDTVARVLPPAVAQGLADYARERGVTLATVGLALFSSLLYRLARQTDLVVGMGVAGRDRAALEGLIGFFVNVLPIRLSFDDETEFDGLVDQTHAALMGALEYRDYPFDLLVRAVAPKRSGNRQPLVNVVFEYQHFQDLGADMAVDDGPALGAAGDGTGDGAGVLDPAFMQEVETAIRPATAKHDLLLFLTDRPDRMEFLLEYDTDVIDRPTAERWLAYLGQFATMIVNRPGKEAAE